jgi:hypothetical protein
MMRTCVRTVVLVCLLPGLAWAGAKFKSTWKAPDIGEDRLAGHKVVALIMADDDSLRVSGEEALARELSQRGAEGVAAYRLIPKEEIRDAEKAKGWFERAGVQGVVVMRVVSADVERTYSPGTWVSPYYGTLWGYYGYGWGGMYLPGRTREDLVLVVETLIYSVPRDKLLWAGISETKNPKQLQKAVADIVESAAKEMKKQGLVSK